MNKYLTPLLIAATLAVMLAVIAVLKLISFRIASPVCLMQSIHHLVSARPSATEPKLEDRIVAREASEAANIYFLSHHNRYPVASHWEEAIKPYWNKNIPFSVVLTGGRRLAMNSNLSGKGPSQLDTNDNTILFYETTSTHQDANGLPPSIPLYQTSGTVPVAICVDGHSVNE